MISEDLKLYQDLVPEGCQPSWGLRIIEYIKPDGTQAFQWCLDAEAPVGRSYVLGTIEQVKDQLLHPEPDDAAED